MKTMKFIISKDGMVKLDVEGAVGPVCRDFTHLFERAVGNVVRCELKPEYEKVREIVREKTRESAD
jgi:hypothetical protein